MWGKDTVNIPFCPATEVRSRCFSLAPVGGYGLIASLLTPMLMATPAWSHGAHIEYEMTQAIQLTARYDNGAPMAEAQVTVYSPSDPANAWQKGVTDAEGRFIFAPDSAQSGNWEVQVRQAGHGDIVAIPVAEAAPDHDPEALIPSTPTSASGSEDGTGLQKGLMVAAVIWGCVGTALFFSRQKK